MEVLTLSADDVLQIYEILLHDFASTSDPIAPAGVRSHDLLESAVSRQHTHNNGTLKYPDPITNAATLTYGLCNNHPFHNGNKRTALVAMLVHLDRNRVSLYDVCKDDLYEMILAVAKHTLGLTRTKKQANLPAPRRHADDEVAAIAKWLQARAQRVKRGEKQLTYKQLRRILARFDVSLDNPHNNTIDIMKRRIVKKGVLRRREEVEWVRLGSVGYHDEGSPVSFKDIKLLRKIAGLREEDGVDSEAFYETAEVIDAFVNRYRTILRRLAKQ